jgi:hypothetical protein
MSSVAFETARGKKSAAVSRTVELAATLRGAARATFVSK